MTQQIFTSAFWYQLNRDVITVSGVDARKFLHSQLANEIATLKVGNSCYSLLLEPTGKITSLVRVHRIAEDRFVLDTEAGFGEVTAKRLSRFKIRVKCEITTSSRTDIALRLLSQEDHAKLITEPGALNAWRTANLAIDLADNPADGFTRFSTSDEVKISSLRQGAFNDYEHARVLAHWPQMGIDVTSDSIPSETGLTDVAVSFIKGCYPGQELVERMDSRGTAAPRSLRVIRATPGATCGASVVLDGKDIGIYTTVVGNIALALIKRSADSSSLEIVS